MKPKIALITVVTALMALAPLSMARADVPAGLMGRILIDVSSHGEAWYVNPRSHMRVSLGRPREALERLVARAFHVNYMHIERLAERVGDDHDVEYAETVAGHVIQPDDLLGAAWYVDPNSKLRRRLATSHDAWEIMKSGVPVNGDTLAGIPVEQDDPPKITEVEVTAVKTADIVELDDGSEVRLLSVDIPSNEDLQEAAKSRLRELLLGRKVMLERDWKDTDRSGRMQRYVHSGEVNVNLDLVRRGLAFHNVEYPNFEYAEQLIVAGIDAMRHGFGFWSE
ncbi:MAG: thermonuclease family protein [Patescibacteria group bacterium]|nr:thermonuclease family protein [Patescibacteria group bacterium]